VPNSNLVRSFNPSLCPQEEKEKESRRLRTQFPVHKRGKKKGAPEEGREANDRPEEVIWLSKEERKAPGTKAGRGKEPNSSIKISNPDL